jgi:hypothetical protein
MGYHSQTLTMHLLAKLATDEHPSAQAQTPSHPSRTVATSIPVEEPSQPSCCDMITTLRSLSSRAGHPALCAPGCWSTGAVVPAFVLWDSSTRSDSFGLLWDVNPSRSTCLVILVGL